MGLGSHSTGRHAVPDWEEKTTLVVFLDEAAGRWSAREALTVVIVAESGIDLARFETAPRLAAWAGVAPGQGESAGQQRSGNTRQGPHSLRVVRTPRAHAAVHTKGTSLAALSHRLAAQRGQQRALMAGAHAIMRRVFPRLARNEPYHELGANSYAERRRHSTVERRARRMAHLGYRVHLALWPMAVV
jgi:hypothetical protein